QVRYECETKKMTAWCLCAIGLVPLTFGGGIGQKGAQAASSGRILYVATTGNDSWSGRFSAPNSQKSDGPLLTLRAARDRIRAARKADRAGAPTVVLIREGTYPITEPLVLTPEDSGRENEPMIYAAYPGERPVISGGRRI